MGVQSRLLRVARWHCMSNSVLVVRRRTGHFGPKVCVPSILIHPHSSADRRLPFVCLRERQSVISLQRSNLGSRLRTSMYGYLRRVCVRSPLSTDKHMSKDSLITFSSMSRTASDRFSNHALNPRPKILLVPASALRQQPQNLRTRRHSTAPTPHRRLTRRPPRSAAAHQRRL